MLAKGDRKLSLRSDSHIERWHRDLARPSLHLKAHQASFHRMVGRPVIEIAKSLKVAYNLVICGDGPDMSSAHQFPSRHIECVLQPAGNSCMVQGHHQGDMGWRQANVRSHPTGEKGKLLKLFHGRCVLNCHRLPTA